MCAVRVKKREAHRLSKQARHLARNKTLFIINPIMVLWARDIGSNLKVYKSSSHISRIGNLILNICFVIQRRYVMHALEAIGKRRSCKKNIREHSSWAEIRSKLSYAMSLFISNLKWKKPIIHHPETLVPLFTLWAKKWFSFLHKFVSEGHTHTDTAFKKLAWDSEKQLMND